MKMKFSICSEDIAVLKAIALILDLDDHVKLCHSYRVAYLSYLLAKKIGIDFEQEVLVAGFIHDLGVFDVSNAELHEIVDFSIVKNPSIRIHPQKGAAIIAALPGYKSVARIIMNHHEWVDGSGYPRGLIAAELSLETQILRIADSFAFAIDRGTYLDKGSLLAKMRTRVGKEYSKELYDSISEIITDDVWSVLIDDMLVVHNVNAVFEHYASDDQCHRPMYSSLLLLFGKILDAKHSYSEGHSRRVAYYSEILALGLGLEDSVVDKIVSGAFLHDIGKLAIPKEILDCPRKLTEEEFELIKQHAELSHDIVLSIPAFASLADVVGADQEHWDGSGYPNGLKAEQIPLGARLIFVADAFDAMTSTRSYRKAMSVDDALEELKKSSGTDFDPKIVDLACVLFKGFDSSVFTSESSALYSQTL